MAERSRRVMAGGLSIAVLAVVGALVLFPDDDAGPDLPRIRVSIPGAESELDLFAQESEPVLDEDGDDGPSDVIEIAAVDDIRTAFEADLGRPRLILLVDPL